MFLKDEDGNMYLRPRSRNTKKEFVNKIDWVPHLHSFFEELPNGTCFLGEIYLPSDEQAKTTTSIMNCLVDKAIKRQEKEKLVYYIFDVLAFNGKLYLEEPAHERFELLESIPYNTSDYNPFFGDYKYIEWARYVTGKELWNLIQNLLADGYEGVVITRGDSHYLPGKRTNKDTLKIKKELQDTIDCVVIGANAPSKISKTKEVETWEFWFDERNNKKITASDYLNQFHETIYKSYVEGAPVIPVTKNWFYGWAGSLKLGLYDGDTLKYIGDLSGINDEIKKDWKKLVNTVVEVSCMEIMDNAQGGKGLRHPKAINFNRDKDPRECIMEQIL